MSDLIKKGVLQNIACGKPIVKVGQVKWLIGTVVVHVRYCSRPKSDGVTFGYNVNPTSLASDYELWICCTKNVYYLVPIEEIKTMYNHPHAYVDKRHTQMRVIGIDTSTHLAIYATGGIKRNLVAYYGTTL